MTANTWNSRFALILSLEIQHLKQTTGLEVFWFDCPSFFFTSLDSSHPSPVQRGISAKFGLHQVPSYILSLPKKNKKKNLLHFQLIFRQIFDLW